MDEPRDETFSLTASEAATVLVVGVAVAGTAYCVARTRRFLRRIDPTSEFRGRLRAARADYREEVDAWRGLGLFAPTLKRLRSARASYGEAQSQIGQAGREFGILLRNIRAVREGRG